MAVNGASALGDRAHPDPGGYAEPGVDDPAQAFLRPRPPSGQEVAGDEDAAVDVGPLDAVEVERKGVSIVDDTQSDVGLPVGQVHRLGDRQDLHADLWMPARERDEVRHEEVVGENGRQRDPKRPAHVLVASEDPGLELLRRGFHLFGEAEYFDPGGSQPIARREPFEDLSS